MVLCHTDPQPEEEDGSESDQLQEESTSSRRTSSKKSKKGKGKEKERRRSRHESNDGNEDEEEDDEGAASGSGNDAAAKGGKGKISDSVRGYPLQYIHPVKLTMGSICPYSIRPSASWRGIWFAMPFATKRAGQALSASISTRKVGCPRAFQRECMSCQLTRCISNVTSLSRPNARLSHRLCESQHHAEEQLRHGASRAPPS